MKYFVVVTSMTRRLYEVLFFLKPNDDDEDEDEFFSLRILSHIESSDTYFEESSCFNCLHLNYEITTNC